MEARNNTVLVVEDDPEIRECVAELLELEGYEVHTAANGRQAFDWLIAHPPPRLMVLDLMMPVMNGWQLLEKMREEELDIPVIVTSANLTRDIEATEVLEKPYQVDDLLDAVKHCAA